MAPSRLRIYYGPHDDRGTTTLDQAHLETETVTVPLGEIIPLLGQAVCSGRTWLKDFEDDELTISSDLYEVILAYQHYRRPSA